MPNPPLKPEQMQEALDTLARHGSPKKAAESLKMARGTFDNRVRRARAAGLSASAEAVTDGGTQAQQERIVLADRVKELQAELGTVERLNLSVSQVRTEIMRLAEHSPDPPQWLTRTEIAPADPGVPMCLWSDWHAGEMVKPEQVGGHNEFNLRIMHARVRKLVQKIIDLGTAYLKTDKLAPGLVLPFLGDFVSGDIHDELRETNEKPLMVTLLDLVDTLLWALKKLADVYGRLFIPCVIGNHGRNTHKPRYKDSVYTNFDWLLYNLLEKALQDDGRIVFLIPDGVDVHFRVFGHRYMATHGNALGTRGGDGIIGALGPILRGDHKVRKAQESLSQPYDTLLVGHWHFTAHVGRVICNNSLKGYDEYAMGHRFEAERPSQSMWFTHPALGIVWPNEVYLENAPKRESAPWVSWSDNLKGEKNDE